MTIVLAGLGAGIVHVVTGADHLAALLPLSAGQGPRAARWGLRWGIGHTVGVAVVGLAGVALKESIDLAGIVGPWAESLVGLMLIAIGAWGLRNARGYRVHDHVHAHGDTAHAHKHVHNPLAPKGEHAHKNVGRAAFGAGILHGVAGTSHFLAILPAVALPTWVLSITYLLAYGAGSIGAMAAFSASVGLISSSIRVREMLVGASIITIAVGLWWLAAGP